MNINRSIPLVVLLVCSVALAACGVPTKAPVTLDERQTVEAAQTASEQTAEAAGTATREAEQLTAAPILTRIAAQLTQASAAATPTDIVAIGATPEDAALLTLKAWATVPYQNEQAQALSKNDQQAQIKVSAEFKDSGTGTWVPQEAITQCVHIHTGWKCLPTFKFQPAATPAPAS